MLMLTETYNSDKKITITFYIYWESGDRLWRMILYSDESSLGSSSTFPGFKDPGFKHLILPELAQRFHHNGTEFVDILCPI